MELQSLEKFYCNKKVLVTGHTGFKGSWLCFILSLMGADVYGYALPPSACPNAYGIMKVENKVHSCFGDIRDFEKLNQWMQTVNPDIVFHLAAQPIVRESYQLPRETYEINTMGTVNLLDCVRKCEHITSVINVTTDKVYDNLDIPNHSFTEEEKLDGFDPYSNSKSCSELVTHSYMRSFFNSENSPVVSTVRAGNVIGGGDFAKDRIIPDCIRAIQKREPIVIRNPYSERPYQHVLDPLFVYLQIAMRQAEDRTVSGFYNIGPGEDDCMLTEAIVRLFVDIWGEGIQYIVQSVKEDLHEANYLRLNCEKIRTLLGWNPVWKINEAVEKTVFWYKAWDEQYNMEKFTADQIKEFEKKSNEVCSK